MILKIVMIIGCITGGMAILSVLFFIGYSIFWMIQEYKEEREEIQPGALEIPWGEDYDR